MSSDQAMDKSLKFKQIVTSEVRTQKKGNLPHIADHVTDSPLIKPNFMAPLESKALDDEPLTQMGQWPTCYHTCKPSM